MRNLSFLTGVVLPMLPFLAPLNTQAATPACGATVTTNTTFGATNMNCTGYMGDYALRAGANDITIDCAGRSIAGPDAAVGNGVQTDHYGFFVNGKSGVTLQNCTITQFERNVVLDGVGTRASIWNNNIGRSTRYGVNIINGAFGDIFSNLIHHAGDENLHISDTSCAVGGSVVEANAIYSSVNEGIYLLTAPCLTIWSNDVHSNAGVGLYAKQSDTGLLFNNDWDDVVQFIGDSDGWEGDRDRLTASLKFERDSSGVPNSNDFDCFTFTGNNFVVFKGVSGGNNTVSHANSNAGGYDSDSVSKVVNGTIYHSTSNSITHLYGYGSPTWHTDPNNTMARTTSATINSCS